MLATKLVDVTVAEASTVVVLVGLGWLAGLGLLVLITKDKTMDKELALQHIEGVAEKLGAICREKADDCLGASMRATAQGSFEHSVKMKHEALMMLEAAYALSWIIGASAEDK